jgi:hypothetical protein
MAYIYNISNDPLTGLKRKIEVTELLNYERIKELKTVCEVTYYNASDEDVRSRIAPRIVVLTATMFNYVDNQGNYVEEGTEGAIPEYLFWEGVITGTVFSKDALYASVVAKADDLNRF